MRTVVDQHIVGILKKLSPDACKRTDPGAEALLLTKYLENLPHNDLLIISAIMYAGRDQNPPRKIEQYIEKCGIFTKEQLVQAMVIRLDALQEYLNHGLALTTSNASMDKSVAKQHS